MNLQLLSFPLYGIMLATGFLLSVVLATIRSRRHNIPFEKIAWFYIGVIMIGLIGGKLGSKFIYGEARENILDGQSFIGSLSFVVLSSLLLHKFSKLNFIPN